MNDIKVSLTIILKGRVMYSKQECLKQLKEVYTDKKGHKRTKFKMVEDWDKFEFHHMKVDAPNGGKEVLNVHTRKCKGATQSTKLSTETYNYMISDACPFWSKPSDWNRMSKKLRLESHLKRMAEHLGGTLLEYQVFED